MLVKAASRRSRARAARALTGVACFGIGLQSVMRISFRSDRQEAKLGSVPATHCADLLTVRENLAMCAHSRKSAIRPCTISRPTAAHLAPLSCYQAVGGLRLAGPALSFAEPPSDKNQDKQNTSRFRADLAQLISRVFVDRRCSSCLLAGRQNAGAAAVAPVVSNSGAGRSQADRSQSDVIMSGIVDSGR